MMDYRVINFSYTVGQFLYLLCPYESYRRTQHTLLGNLGSCAFVCFLFLSLLTILEVDVFLVVLMIPREVD